MARLYLDHVVVIARRARLPIRFASWTLGPEGLEPSTGAYGTRNKFSLTNLQVF
jgi:hypothetical protein